MQRSVYIRKLLMAFMLLFCINGWAQQRLQSVRVVPVNAQTFRIQYNINKKDSEQVSVQVHLYKLSAGVETEIMNALSPISAGKGNQSITWTDRFNELKKGDKIRAEVIAEIKTPRQDLSKAQPPRAVIAGGSNQIVQLPQQTFTLQSGSTAKSGTIVKTNWAQIGGPPCIIEQPDHAQTSIKNLQEGLYTFVLTVEDEHNKSSTARVNVIVQRPPETQTKTATVTPPPKIQRRDTAARLPVTAQVKKPDTATSMAIQKNTHPAAPGNISRTAPIAQAPIQRPVTYAPPKMKGGPSSAFLNLLLPGLGHYKVSGDYNGDDRKGSSFLVTAFYLGAAAGAVYFKGKSISEYNTYANLAKFREVQKDANGNVIGIRGGNEAEALGHYQAANTFNKYSYILIGTSAATLVGDFIWTLAKGMKNKKAYDKEYPRKSVSFIYNPFSKQINAGITLHF